MALYSWLMGSPSLTIAFYLHIKQKRGHADVESLVTSQLPVKPEV